MVESQAQEKLELVTAENRRLTAEVLQLRQANKLLAQQLIERGETIVMLEIEAKRRKQRRKGR